MPEVDLQESLLTIRNVFAESGMKCWDYKL